MIEVGKNGGVIETNETAISRMQQFAEPMVFLLQHRFEIRLQRTMVDAAQRMNTVGASGHDSVETGLVGFEECRHDCFIYERCIDTEYEQTFGIQSSE